MEWKDRYIIKGLKTQDTNTAAAPSQKSNQGIHNKKKGLFN